MRNLRQIMASQSNQIATRTSPRWRRLPVTFYQNLAMTDDTVKSVKCFVIGRYVLKSM